MLKFNHQKINQFQKVLLLIDLETPFVSLFTVCKSIEMIDDDDDNLSKVHAIYQNKSIWPDKAHGLLKHVFGQCNLSKQK